MDTGYIEGWGSQYNLVNRLQLDKNNYNDWSKEQKMGDFEIVDLLSLRRQMTLVVFRDPDTQKCEVQLLLISLTMTGDQNIQAMLKIPSEPEDEAATVSVEVDAALSREIMDWCGTRGISSEQLVRTFVCFAVNRKTQIL